MQEQSPQHEQPEPPLPESPASRGRLPLRWLRVGGAGPSRGEALASAAVVGTVLTAFALVYQDVSALPDPVKGEPSLRSRTTAAATSAPVTGGPSTPRPPHVAPTPHAGGSTAGNAGTAAPQQVAPGSPSGGGPTALHVPVVAPAQAVPVSRRSVTSRPAPAAAPVRGRPIVHAASVRWVAHPASRPRPGLPPAAHPMPRAHPPGWPKPRPFPKGLMPLGHKPPKHPVHLASPGHWPPGHATPGLPWPVSGHR